VLEKIGTNIKEQPSDVCSKATELEAPQDSRVHLFFQGSFPLKPF
jgi:hypothetical protein